MAHPSGQLDLPGEKHRLWIRDLADVPYSGNVQPPPQANHDPLQFPRAEGYSHQMARLYRGETGGNAVAKRGTDRGGLFRSVTVASRLRRPPTNGGIDSHLDIGHWDFSLEVARRVRAAARYPTTALRSPVTSPEFA